MNITITDPHIIIEHPENKGRAVTLICGPPGSGKTTIALQLHPKTLDLAEMPRGEPRDRMRSFGRQSWRIGRSRTPDVTVIRGAPTKAERDKQLSLCRPARTIIMLTGATTCHQRVAARNRNPTADADAGGLDGQHHGIDVWWSRWDNNTPPGNALDL